MHLLRVIQDRILEAGRARLRETSRNTIIANGEISLRTRALPMATRTQILAGLLGRTIHVVLGETQILAVIAPGAQDLIAGVAAAALHHPVAAAVADPVQVRDRQAAVTSNPTF